MRKLAPAPPGSNGGFRSVDLARSTMCASRTSAGAAARLRGGVQELLGVRRLRRPAGLLQDLPRCGPGDPAGRTLAWRGGRRRPADPSADRHHVGRRLERGIDAALRGLRRSPAARASTASRDGVVFDYAPAGRRRLQPTAVLIAEPLRRSARFPSAPSPAPLTRGRPHCGRRAARRRLLV